MTQFKTHTPQTLGKELADLHRHIRDLENRRAYPSYAVTAGAGGSVGSGSTNRLARWMTPTTIGDSHIQEDGTKLLADLILSNNIALRWYDHLGTADKGSVALGADDYLYCDGKYGLKLRERAFATEIMKLSFQFVRLQNAASITWKNFAGTEDNAGIAVAADNSMHIGGVLNQPIVFDNGFTGSELARIIANAQGKTRIRIPNLGAISWKDFAGNWDAAGIYFDQEDDWNIWTKSGHAFSFQDSEGANEIFRVTNKGFTATKLISPAKDFFMPWASRMAYNAFVSFDGTYLIAWTKPQANQSASLYSINHAFDGGSYQWVGRCNAPQSGSNKWWGFEWHHGYISDGCIAFHIDPNATKTNPGEDPQTGTYWAVCATGGTEGYGGSAYYKLLSGQNWQNETTFKFVWTSGQVLFYTDANLVATITTSVPAITKEMPFFIEETTGGTAPSYNAFTYLKKESFEEL